MLQADRHAAAGARSVNAGPRVAIAPPHGTSRWPAHRGHLPWPSGGGDSPGYGHPGVSGFRLLAEPWWVNLAVLVPLLSFYFWRRTGLAIAGRTLAPAAAFAVAFGFVEAAVVVYLRAAIELFPGRDGVLDDPLALQEIPQHLLQIEVLREVATIVMLTSVALLGARRAPQRWAMFLFVFALWDLAYYAGLRAATGWPPSLLSDDILFLIPVPWIADVWYPLLVSSLTVLAVLRASRWGASAPC